MIFGKALQHPTNEIEAGKELPLYPALTFFATRSPLREPPRVYRPPTVSTLTNSFRPVSEETGKPFRPDPFLPQLHPPLRAMCSGGYTNLLPAFNQFSPGYRTQ